MKITPNKQYTDAAPYVKLVRDCIEGEPTIKREGRLYLKHPDMIDSTSAQSSARYSAYIDGAEFDGFPASTKQTMIGRMQEGEITAELPDKIAYLKDNADGDGMPLGGLVELIYSNLAEVKFHVLLSEMDSLASVDTESLSVADIEELSLKSTIKSYTREALIDWDFTRINGIMQLSLLVLSEHEQTRNMDDLSIKAVETCLMLGLDESGDYYQKKYVKSGGGEFKNDGPAHYPQVSGRNLKWIPVEIVCDEEVPAGKIPKGMGYLYDVCSTALYRYRMSADYKEAMRHMQPTLFTGGWKQNDKEMFNELNGRDYIAFGTSVSNNMPEGVTYDIVGLGVIVAPFEKYFESNAKRANSAGATLDNDNAPSNQSATHSAIEDEKKTAAMTSIVKNTEAALKRVISYCGMFMGLWKPEDVESALDQINLVLPREFGRVTLAADDIRVIIELVNGAIIPRSEAIKKLVQGGFSVSTAEELIGELETQPPASSAGLVVTKSNHSHEPESQE